MEYVLFIVSDSAAPTCIPEEDNIEEWVADLESRGRFLRYQPPAR